MNRKSGLDDQSFVQQISNNLGKLGSTKNGASYLCPKEIGRVSKIFKYLDPYVQAVLLQSVVYVPNYENSPDIIKGYKSLIDQGLQSSDEWVLSTSRAFQNYPQITYEIDPEILEKMRILENFPYVEVKEEDYFDVVSDENFRIENRQLHPPSQDLDNSMTGVQPIKNVQRPNPIQEMPVKIDPNPKLKREYNFVSHKKSDKLREMLIDSDDDEEELSTKKPRKTKKSRK